MNLTHFIYTHIYTFSFQIVFKFFNNYFLKKAHSFAAFLPSLIIFSSKVLIVFCSKVLFNASLEVEILESRNTILIYSILLYEEKRKYINLSSTNMFTFTLHSISIRLSISVRIYFFFH